MTSGMNRKRWPKRGGFDALFLNIQTFLNLGRGQKFWLFGYQLFSTREKFFNEDVQLVHMKEMVKENHGSNHGVDECCSIAESMMDEIHHIAIPESSAISSSGRRHKGSLKKMLLRQIRQAKKMAMMG
jgi:hypothetical protein